MTKLHLAPLGVSTDQAEQLFLICLFASTVLLGCGGHFLLQNYNKKRTMELLQGIFWTCGAGWFVAGQEVRSHLEIVASKVFKDVLNDKGIILQLY